MTRDQAGGRAAGRPGHLRAGRRCRVRPGSGWWPGCCSCCSSRRRPRRRCIGVYQAQWRFSATTLTAVFAVYVLVLLLTLLVFGSLSDYLGRRRVIAVALAASAGACGLFLAAHGVGLLFAARALQGAAVGAATSAAGAALIDLQPDRSGRGPVVTSATVLLGLGPRRAGHQRAGPVRPGAHPSGLVAAPGRLRRRRRGRAGDPGDRAAAPRRRWPRSGHGRPCRARHAGRSRWPCRS